MFDLEFPGTYQRYKSGTAKIINWLFENATSCGYKPANLETSIPESKGAKKGKKKAKKPSVATTYNIGAWEIPVLAEAVANSKPEIEIPAWFPVVLEQVVSGRKEAADWYALHSDQSASTQDRRHRHFILVLEDVLRILRPRFEAITGFSYQRDKFETQSEATFAKTINPFDLLEVEEADEGSSFVPSTTGPKESKETPKSRVVYNAELNTEEKSFAVHCFFADFAAVREHVRDAWHKYELGIIDLVAAAVITNTAFELFQRFEKDLVATMPDDLKSQGFEELGRLLAEFSPVWNEESYKCNCHYYEMADKMCKPIYCHLAEYLDDLKSTQAKAIIVHRLDEECYLNHLSTCMCELNAKAKFENDRCVLLGRLLPGLCAVAEAGSNFKLPVQDELTKGARQMMKQRVIPIWLVLAFQTFLDIHYILTSAMGMPRIAH